MSWPTESAVCCHWCCHRFETIPVPLPIRYDDRRNIFQVMGTFCSFSCAKAYNNSSSRGPGQDRSCTLLSLLRTKVQKQAFGRVDGGYGIKMAPDRYLLSMFGGGMSIEQFRRGSDTLVSLGDAERRRSGVQIAAGEESKTVYAPDLEIQLSKRKRAEGLRMIGAGPQQDASDTGEDPDADTTGMFDRIEVEQEGEKKVRKRAAGGSSASATGGGARKRANNNNGQVRDEKILTSIRDGIAVKNQPYRLKRATPHKSQNVSLFQSMNIRLARDGNDAAVP